MESPLFTWVNAALLQSRVKFKLRHMQQQNQCAPSFGVPPDKNFFQQSVALAKNQWTCMPFNVCRTFLQLSYSFRSTAIISTVNVAAAKDTVFATFTHSSWEAGQIHLQTYLDRRFLNSFSWSFFFCNMSLRFWNGTVWLTFFSSSYKYWQQAVEFFFFNCDKQKCYN